MRVEAGRLRSKLREYYEGEGRADPVRFELSKGSYMVHLTWREKLSSVKDAEDAAHIRLIEDKPSLAVLPFDNMSSDPEQAYFADGFTDCLITEISRLSGLFVISRQSSFGYRNAVKRAEDIGSELGVKYLLEGSVQRAGAWVRITAQLIDAGSGLHLWAERYDRELKDIFALQDDVTRRIASVLQVKLASEECDRFGHEGTASLEAHDELLRGLERFWVYTRESAEEARVHFAKAVALDPGYATAHAWLAHTLVFQWVFLWDASEATLERAFEHARAAVDLDPQHPFAYSVLGWVQCWRQQGEASIAAGRRAVALDPNNADAHFFLAITLAASNRAEEGKQYVLTGMRLNPRLSPFNQLALGFCHFVQEEYDEAIAAFKCGIEAADVFIPNHTWLSVTYILLGRHDEARVHYEKVLALTDGRKPVVQAIWLDDQLRTKMGELMRRAGFA